MLQTISIIVLDSFEEPIVWLDTEVTNITETRKMNMVREINITYPLGLYEEHDMKEWFKQGNKIYVPSTLGIDSCLYIINSTYSIDYWEHNQVTVPAEEVLVELNNIPYWYTDTKTIKLDYKFMDAEFGEVYDIDEDIKFPSGQDTILPKGSMTKMELLRIIEDTTDLVTVTEYVSVGTKIERKLSMVSVDDIGKLWDSNVLDLNYNLESLEFEVSEEDTFNAMFPEITLNENQMTGMTIATETTNNPNALIAAQQISTTEDLQKVIESWLDLKVDHREYIPMIVEKTQEGISYTAHYYSPFVKEKGDIMIKNPIYTETSYDKIIPYKTKEVKKNPMVKAGSVSTTQTDVWSIFSVCANKLLDHRNPKYKLKISLKDLQSILPEDSPLGFCIWDTLLVKAPSFETYIPVTVTETKKNPHLAGDNTITVESNITQKHALYDSHITSYNQIINSDEEVANIGGVLYQNAFKNNYWGGENIDDSDEENELSISDDIGELIPIANGDIIINISLKKGYTEDEIYDVVYNIKEFKPSTETYQFTDDEILNTEKYVRNYIITNSKYPASVNMKDVKGIVYRVPFQWVRAIYYTYIQLFTESELGRVGKGSFVKTVQVHEFPFKDVTVENIAHDAGKYYPSWFYHSITKWQDYIKNTLGVTDSVDDIVSSGDMQTGGDCVPTACSNGSEILWNYKSEEQMAKIIKTYNYTRGKGSQGGTKQGNEALYLPKEGYDSKSIDNTWDELYAACRDVKSMVIGHVYASDLPWYSVYSDLTMGSHTEGHGVHVRWAGLSSTGEKYVYIEDSNFTAFEPVILRLNRKTNKKESLPPETFFLKWDEFYSALKKQGSVKDLYVISLSNAQLVSNVVDRSSVTDKELHAKLIKYEFALNELKNAFNELYTNLAKRPNQIPNTMSVKLTAKDGVSYILDGRTIKCLVLGLFYDFKGKYKTINDHVTAIDKNTNWYIDNYGKTGDIIPMYCDKAGKEVYYAVTNILYHLGIIALPFDLEKSYPNITNFSQICTMINEQSPKERKKSIYSLKIDRIPQNLKRRFEYSQTKGDPVIYGLSFVKSDTIHNMITNPSSEYHPIIITGVEGSYFKVIIPEIEGNTPSKTGALTHSPIQKISFADYNSWCNAYDVDKNERDDEIKVILVGLSDSALGGTL